MRIGVFDSGIGGLTVLSEAIALYPHAHYLYYADTENVPYGKKSKKEIKKLVLKAVEFLVEDEIDLLVIACNTATSVAVKLLRKIYTIPIIGMEPAVKPATQITKETKSQNRILVCATKLTLKEQKLIDLISDLNATDKVDLLSLQKLVSYAEKFMMDTGAVRLYLKKKFSGIEWDNYNSLVLGCTHFLFYKNLIKTLVPEHIEIIDGNSGTVRRMVALLPEETKKIKGKITFYRSGEKIKPGRFRKFLDYYKLL